MSIRLDHPVGNKRSRIRLSQPAGFDPTSLPGLEVWFDARYPNGIGVAAPADGAAVAQWNDLSGNNRHATQGTAGKRPTYQSAGRNLLPSLEFEEANADTLAATVGALNVATVSAYAVVELDSNPTGNGHVFRIGSSASLFLYLTATTRVPRFSAGSSQPTAAAPALNTPVVLSGMAYTTDAQTFVNGVGGSVATTDPSGTSGTALTIGSSNGTLGLLPGAIAALLIFSTVHDSTQRQEIERWLGDVFGIAVA